MFVDVLGPLSAVALSSESQPHIITINYWHPATFVPKLDYDFEANHVNLSSSSCQEAFSVGKPSSEKLYDLAQLKQL